MPLSRDGNPTAGFLVRMSEAIFAMLDDEGQEVASGFFVSPTQAVTIYHGAKPKEQTKLKGVTVCMDDTRIIRSFVAEKFTRQ